VKVGNGALTASNEGADDCEAEFGKTWERWGTGPALSGAVWFGSQHAARATGPDPHITKQSLASARHLCAGAATGAGSTIASACTTASAWASSPLGNPAAEAGYPCDRLSFPPDPIIPAAKQPSSQLSRISCPDKWHDDLVEDAVDGLVCDRCAM
jgi:hypothetical protein